MYYFAYGSNMDEKELTDYMALSGRDPSGISNPRWARLNGWRLVFNYFSPSRGAGAANVEKSDGHWVEGVLWDVTGDAMAYIDKKEGSPSYYERVPGGVEVSDRQGELHRAVTYQVVHKRRLDNHCPPTVRYLDKMKAAGRRFTFSQEYQQLLNGVETTEPRDAAQQHGQRGG